MLAYAASLRYESSSKVDIIHSSSMFFLIYPKWALSLPLARSQKAQIDDREVIDLSIPVERIIEKAIQKAPQVDPDRRALDEPWWNCKTFDGFRSSTE